MGVPIDDPTSGGTVTVSFWAAARAAVGVATDEIPVTGSTRLSELVAEVLRRYPTDQVERVLGVCSVVVGDRPVGSHAPHDVWVAPGDRVEFLPPFAGG